MAKPRVVRVLGSRANSSTKLTRQPRLASIAPTTGFGKPQVHASTPSNASAPGTKVLAR